MEISSKGVELIKEFEGFSKKPYKCSANKLTIGYGHVIRPEEKEMTRRTITVEEGENLLKNDIKRFEKYLNDIIKKNKILLKQNQFDALISFIFNTGYLKESMLQRFSEKDLQAVGDALLMYNKANGIELKGLTKRRQKERELFFS